MKKFYVIVLGVIFSLNFALAESGIKQLPQKIKGDPLLGILGGF